MLIGARSGRRIASFGGLPSEVKAQGLKSLRENSNVLKGTGFSPYINDAIQDGL